MLFSFQSIGGKWRAGQAVGAEAVPQLNDLIVEQLGKQGMSLVRAYRRVWGDAFALDVLHLNARELKTNADRILSDVSGGKPRIIHQWAHGGEVNRLVVIEFAQLTTILAKAALSVVPENELLEIEGEEAWRAFMAGPEHLALSISEPLDVGAAQSESKYSPGHDL
jgi:hypothetical protein